MMMRDWWANSAVSLSYRFLKVGRRSLLKQGRLSASASRRFTRIQRYVMDISRELILRRLMQDAGDAVSAGPFAGMRIAHLATWGDGDLLAKLNGTYEAELYTAFNEIKGIPFQCVINIGCAEGYYAVGAALALNTTFVLAVDIDDAALSATRANAEMNGVAEKLRFRSGLDAAGVCEVVDPATCNLVISDCEGFELEVFSGAAIEALRNSYCLIECHDHLGRDVVGTLTSRFRESHDVIEFAAGERDLSEHSFLGTLHGFDRWVATFENRPEGMRWLFARPIGVSSPAPR